MHSFCAQCGTVCPSLYGQWTASKSRARTYLPCFLPGVSGPVGIDANGDRIPSYQLAYANKDQKFIRFSNYFGPTGAMELLNETVTWHAGKTEIPLGRPPCGFENEYCPEPVKGRVRLDVLCSSVLWNESKKYETQTKGRMTHRVLNRPLDRISLPFQNWPYVFAGTIGKNITHIASRHAWFSGLPTSLLTLSLLRVVNFKFPLQPQHKCYIAQYGKLGFPQLTQMRDDYIANSRYLTDTVS